MELYFVFCEHAQSLNHVQLFENPCTTACQAPLSLEFPSQECWSCLSFPPSGDLPTQGSNPCLLHWQVDSVLLSHMGSPIYIFSSVQSLNCVRLFCNPMDCSLPGFPVLHHLPEFAQTHVHWVSDAIPTISSSIVPLSSFPQFFPASGFFFPVSQLFASGG